MTRIILGEAREPPIEIKAEYVDMIRKRVGKAGENVV